VSAIVVRYQDTALITDEALGTAIEHLSPDERAQQRRFVRREDRRDFVAAHSLLRRVLSEHVNVAPHEWAFTKGSKGKPYLASGGVDETDLSFNLSHTLGLVACAVTRGADIGVDVEHVDRCVDTLSVADRYFSAAESVHLRECSPIERPRRFFEIWTLKEAYVKATGDGLSGRLDDLAFVFTDLSTSFSCVSLSRESLHNWRFALFRPTENHCLAVAARGCIRPPPQIVISAQC
jgi:4'-phosphopantetheinyl transferase